MSVVVLHGGKRKTVKCGGAPLKTAVEEAIHHFKLNTSFEYFLTHKGKRVDLSTPFRLSSIPNNATLELECSDKKQSSVKCKDTRIALSCDNEIGNLTASFREDVTLIDILKHFVENGSLPTWLFDDGVEFSEPLEMVYLRQRFIGREELQKVSLSSLGLGGSSARFQLRIPSVLVGQKAENAGNYSNAVSTSERIITTAEIVEVAKQQESAFNCEKNSLSDVDAPSNPCPLVGSHSVSDENNRRLAVCESSMDIVNVDDEQNFTETRLSSEAIEKAIESILGSNFDAVSQMALLTAVKYLDNLIKHPNSDGVDDTTLKKYRQINLSNKVIQANIVQCTNGLQLMFSLGFALEKENNEDSSQKLSFCFNTVVSDWILNSSSFKGYDVVESFALNLPEDAVLVSTLLDARSVITSCLKQFEQLAKSASSPMPLLSLLKSISPHQSMEKTAETKVIFNPYKPLVMRSCSDKVEVKQSSRFSSTEAKLSQLQKRRIELEGDRDVIERQTQVSFKKVTSGSFQSNDDYPFEDNNEESDNQLQARALKQSLLRAGNSSDEGPALTTQAIKQLEKAQGELVYSRTLIKVVLPDKVCLEAYFHPRDTMSDIASWLLESCLLRSDSEKYEFDLYIAPPRRTLFSSHNSTGNRKAEESNNTTLQDLKLVPAALVYLAWHGESQKRFGSSPQSSLEKHAYLAQPYLDRLLTSDYVEEKLRIPTGVKLVPETSEVNSGKDSSRTQTAKQEEKVSSNKPKWLKL